MTWDYTVQGMEGYWFCGFVYVHKALLYNRIALRCTTFHCASRSQAAFHVMQHQIKGDVYKTHTMHHPTRPHGDKTPHPPTHSATITCDAF